MRKLLLLAALLLIASAPARAGDFCTTPYPPGAGWSISLGGVFDWGAIGIRFGDGYLGSNWSFSYEYPGFADLGWYEPTYGYRSITSGGAWWYITSGSSWPSYSCYPAWDYGYGIDSYRYDGYVYRSTAFECYIPAHGYYSSYDDSPGYRPFYSSYYRACYSSSPRYDRGYDTTWPRYDRWYDSSRPRHPVEGRPDSHDYRGGSVGHTSWSNPARHAAETAPARPTRRASQAPPPSPTRYAERDRGQQVYWNSRTSIGGSPSMGDRPYRAPPVERSSGRSGTPTGNSDDRGARYRR